MTDSSLAAGGDYTYKVTFDLGGFDPATAVLQGGWATDNAGNDIKLNGTSTGLANSVQFPSLTPFLINSGFQGGVNKLEFLLNNSDAVMGFTGLRVENLRLGARHLGVESPKLSIARQGATVVVSWPTSAAGYNLFRNANLSSTGWTAVSDPVVVVGGNKQVTLPADGSGAFLRLQK